MIKKTLVGIFLLACIHPVMTKAQYIADEVVRSSKIGFVLGSHGIGIEGARSVYPGLSVRVGFNYFPLSSMNIGYQGDPVELNRSHINAFVDWSPFPKGTSFIAQKGYISIGIGHYFENELVRHYREDNEVYTIAFARTNPYIGVGLRDIRAGNALSLGFNLGCFIPTGETAVSMEGGPNEYRHQLLQDKWNGMGYKLLAGMNATAGLYYHF